MNRIHLRLNFPGAEAEIRVLVQVTYGERLWGEVCEWSRAGETAQQECGVHGRHTSAWPHVEAAEHRLEQGVLPTFRRVFGLGWEQGKGQLWLVGSWEIVADKGSERVQRTSTRAVIFKVHHTGDILEMHVLRPHSHILNLKLQEARPSQLLNHAL